jgi:hypothetical protein
MFPKLKIPEHVNMNLGPNPADGGKTFLLTITARARIDAKPLTITKTIPRDIGAIHFGKDLMEAINYLEGKVRG